MSPRVSLIAVEHGGRDLKELEDQTLLHTQSRLLARHFFTVLLIALHVALHTLVVNMAPQPALIDFEYDVEPSNKSWTQLYVKWAMKKRRNRRVVKMRSMSCLSFGFLCCMILIWHMGALNWNECERFVSWSGVDVSSSGYEALELDGKDWERLFRETRESGLQKSLRFQNEYVDVSFYLSPSPTSQNSFSWDLTFLLHCIRRCMILATRDY